MVRTTPETEQAKAKAQWRRAFELLPAEHQRAIALFCLQDHDVASAALKV